MGYFQRYGSIKPGSPVQLDLEHPFSQGLILTGLFQEGRGKFPLLLQSPISSSPLPLYAIASGTVNWSSNLEGWGASFPTVSDCLALSTSSVNDLPAAWVPTTAVTICIIRRKLDTTNRQASLFGIHGASVNNSELCGANVPWSDGVVYWDFGYNGFNPPNRLSVSGLSFSTIVPERWILHAGPQ